MSTSGIKYMLLATFYFALMNVCVKLLAKIPAIEIVFFRAVVTLAISYVILHRLGISPWGNNKKLLITRGLAGSAGLYLYFYTVQHMPLASAVTIQYLSPIFTAILAIVLLKEKLYPLQWLFFAMAFAGVLLIKGFDDRITTGLLMAGVGSALCSGLAYNNIRKLKQTDHTHVIVFYFPLVTLPLSLPVLGFEWQMPEGFQWVLLIMTGVFTQLGQVYMTMAYQEEEAANIAIINYSGIIYALILGYLVFDEQITFLSMMGIVVVLAAVMANIAYIRWKRKRIQPEEVEEIVEQT